MSDWAHAIPQDLHDLLATESEKTRALYLDMAAKNDPDLRRHTRQALEAEGIRIDPAQLEIALDSTGRFHDIDSEDSFLSRNEKRVNDKHKDAREKLTVFFTGLPEALSTMERSEWRYYILSNLLNNASEDGYWNYRFLQNNLAMGLPWNEALDVKQDPAILSGMMQRGEDPLYIALMAANIWGNRGYFNIISHELDTHIMHWNDRYSLVYEQLFSSIKRDRVLCDEIHVEPAGLVQIEPWREDKDTEYDMYGARVADVTAYSVGFVPKNPKEARVLQSAVEKAIRTLTKMEFAFYIPSAAYSDTDKAYKRPNNIEEFEDIAQGWNEFLEQQQVLHDVVYRDGKFEALEKALRDGKIREYWQKALNTDKQHPDYMRFKDARFLCDLWINGKPLPDYVPEWFVDALKSEQDRQDGVRYTYVDDAGRVVLNDPLVLDDVWDLYRLSRAFVEPSEQIAVALNVARYTEERGPIKRPPDIGKEHDYDSTDMDSMLGNLKDIPAENRLAHGLAHVAMMAGTGAATMETSLAQVVALSDATMKGVITDKTGLFPTYKALTDQSDGAVISYAKVAGTRARRMLDAIAVMFGEDDETQPLRERFERAVQNARGMARKQHLVRAAVSNYKWNSRMREEVNFDWMAVRERESADREMALKISDVLSGNFERFAFSHGAYDFSELEKEAKENEGSKADPAQERVQEAIHADAEHAQAKYMHNAMSRRAELAVWSGQVPPQVDRVYKGTTHVSRSHHSPYARLELPEDLAPFVERADARSGRKQFQLDSPDVIFGGGSATRPRPS